MKIHVYSDGSCSYKQGVGGIGRLGWRVEADNLSYSGSEPVVGCKHGPEAELMACIQGIESVLDTFQGWVISESDLMIHTDNEEVCWLISKDKLSNTFNAKYMRDRVSQLRYLLNSFNYYQLAKRCMYDMSNIVEPPEHPLDCVHPLIKGQPIGVVRTIERMDMEKRNRILLTPESFYRHFRLKRD